MSRFGAIQPVRSIGGNTEYIIDPITGEVIGRNKVPTAVRGADNIEARQKETDEAVSSALDQDPETQDR